MKNRFFCLLLTVILVFSAASCKNKNSVSSGSEKVESTASAVTSDKPSYAVDNETPSGAKVIKENINKKVYTEQEELKGDNMGLKMPLSLKDGALKVESFIKYSGTFMEDLSFSETKDSLAARIVNTSGKYIDVAVIRFSLSDGTEASFWLSRLGPGDVCDVQEKSNMKYKKDVIYAVKDVTIKYMDNPEKGWDVTIGNHLVFQCTKDKDGNNIAVVKNFSDKKIKNARVWYKRKIDGKYIGGYTYILNINGELLPGEEKFIKARYFNTECVIIDSEFTAE